MSQELAVIGAILNAHPGIIELAWQDLVQQRRHDTGAPGTQAMGGAAQGRVMSVSYERLAFHLFDSVSCRLLLGLGPFDTGPSASALQDNISRLRSDTREAINRILVKWAPKEGIEAGRKMRFDSIPVEANIHHPTDSSLLVDLVTVICRSVKKADLPRSLRCRDRHRVARKLILKILNAKTARRERA